MITLITAFRTDEHTVYVMYFHNKYHQEFVIEWNNIDPGTGEISEYDLQELCLAGTAGLVTLITDAIQTGETGDCELYLAIRDTFDQLDCVDFSLRAAGADETDQEYRNE